MVDRTGQKPTIERGGYTTIGTANTGENRPPYNSGPGSRTHGRS